MEMLSPFIYGASGGLVLEVMRCLDEELRKSPAPEVKAYKVIHSYLRPASLPWRRVMRTPDL